MRIIPRMPDLTLYLIALLNLLIFANTLLLVLLNIVLFVYLNKSFVEVGNVLLTILRTG